MKGYPSKHSRHAKRKNHYQKYQSARQPSNQNRKQISKQGGRNDHHTA